MRVAPDEFGRDRFDHAAEIERSFLFGDASLEHDLEQQIAKFFPEVAPVAPVDGIGDLVGFLDRVRNDRLECLGQIPGAAGARRAERRHDLDEPRDVTGGLHGRRLGSGNKAGPAPP